MGSKSFSGKGGIEGVWGTPMRKVGVFQTTARSSQVWWTFLCLRLLLVGVGSFWWGSAAGQIPLSSPPTVEEKWLRFRRVFVLAERLSEAPRQNVPYVPVEPAEFEQLVRLVLEQRGPDRRTSSAFVQTARYYARLEAKNLVDGQAILEVAPIGKDGVIPPVYRLDPLSFAAGAISWADRDGQPAKAGWCAAGKYKILVDGPGVLMFPWTCAGTRQQDGTILFPLRFPEAVQTRLTVDAPTEFLPQAEGLWWCEGSPSENVRRWVFELGGRSQWDLVWLPETLALIRPLVALWLGYELGPQGLDLTAQLQLETSERPLEELRLHMAADLEVLEVTAPGAEALWYVREDPEDSDLREVVLRFSPPLKGYGQLIRIRAMGPVRLGQTWTLPFFEYRGPGWERTAIQVTIRPPIELRGFRLQGGRQIPGPSLNRYSEVIYAVYDRPAGRAEIELFIPPPLYTAWQLTVAEFGPRVQKSRVGIAVKALQGEVWNLSARIGPGWFIESLQPEQPGTIVAWRLEEPGGDGVPDSKVLQIDLARPLPSDQWMTFSLECVRRYEEKMDRLPARDLVPIDWPQARDSRIVLGLLGQSLWPWKSPSQPLGKKESSEEPWPKLRQLLGIGDDHPLWQLENIAGCFLRVHPVARYRATVRTVWNLESEVAVGRSWIVCWPEEGASIPRVTLAFRPGSEKQRKWALYTVMDDGNASESAGEGTLRSLPFRVQRQPVPNGELWHIILDYPSRKPVVVMHTAAVPLRPGDELEVVWLPEAVKQELLIGLSRPEENWSLQDTQGSLRPAWNPSSWMLDPELGNSVGQQLGEMVWFHYSVPSRDETSFPKIVIRERGSKFLPAAFVWSQVCHSWIRPGEPFRHRAEFLVEVRSPKTLTFQWDQPVHLLAVQLNGSFLKEPESLRRASIAKYLPGLSAVDPAEGTRKEETAVMSYPPTGEKSAGEIYQEFVVTLENTERFVWVSLLWEDREAAAARVLKVSFPSVTVDAPVLDRRWVVWTPPEYAAELLGKQRPRPVPEALQRLFGTMARSAEEPVFDPFVAESWRELLADPVTKARAVGYLSQWRELIVYSAGTPGPGVTDGAAGGNSQISPEFRGDGRAEVARGGEAQLGAVPQPGPGEMAGEQVSAPQRITWGDFLLALEELVRGASSEVRAPLVSAGQEKVRFSGRAEIPGPLLVDVAALEEVGIGPYTELDPRELARGKPVLELIREAGLALIVHPRAWILTGSSQAEALADRLDPIGIGSGGFVGKGLSRGVGFGIQIRGSGTSALATPRAGTSVKEGVSVHKVRYSPGRGPGSGQALSLPSPSSSYRSPTPERLLALLVPEGREQEVLAKFYQGFLGGTPRFLPAGVWAQRWRSGGLGRPAGMSLGEVGLGGWHATVYTSVGHDGVELRVFPKTLEGLIRWGVAIFVCGLVALLGIGWPMPTLYWAAAGGAILVGMVGDTLAGAAAGGVLIGEVVGVILVGRQIGKGTQSSRKREEGLGGGPEPPAGPAGSPRGPSVRADSPENPSKVEVGPLWEDTAVCRAQQSVSPEAPTMTMPVHVAAPPDSPQPSSGGLAVSPPSQMKSEDAGCTQTAGGDLPERSPGKAGTNPSDGSRPSFDRGGFATLLCLITALWGFAMGGVAFGEEVGPMGAPPGPTYRVLIPADGTGRPTGEKYQVPEPMWTKLTQLAAEASDRWLLSSARYRVRIGQSPDRPGWGVTELRATFDVEVLQAPISMPLPIQPSPAGVIGGLTINGRPVIPTVSELDSRMTVELLSTGRNELEIILVPEQTVTGSEGSMRLPIPPLPQSWLQCTFPSEVRGVEVLKSIGPVVSRPGGGLVEANLGPVDELWLRWSSRVDGSGAPEARMLLLLGLRPEGLIADLFLRFPDGASIPERLEVEIDPEWQWEAVPPNQVQILDPGSPTRRKWVVWLARESEGIRQFGKLRLLLPIPNFTGQVFLSFVSLPQVRVTSRWVAAGASAEVQIQPASPEFVEPLSLTSFAESWGEPVGALAAAWSVPTDRTAAAFFVRPPSSRVAVRESLVVFFKLGRVELEHLAELEPQNLAIFRYQWNVPAGFAVERVEIEEKDQRIAPVKLLWSEDDKLVAVPERPLTGAHRVRVRGWVPVSVAEEAVLPIIRLLGYSSTPIKVDIWASPESLANLKFEGTLLPQPWQSEVAPAQGRFLGGLEVDPNGEKKVRFVLRSNRPEVFAKQLTRADRGREGWFVEVIWLLNISDGTLESLDLLVPAWTVGGWSVEPAGEVLSVGPSGDGGGGGEKMVAEPGKATKVFSSVGEFSPNSSVGADQPPQLPLQVTPYQPISGTKGQPLEAVRVEFERPLTGTRTVRLLWRGEPTGRLFQIPVVRLQNGTVGEHFLLVPRRSDIAVLEGSLASPEEEVLPALATELFAGTQYRCYRLPAEADRVVAVVGMGEPVVTAAWVRCRVSSDGEVVGLASYDIDPVGQPQLRLRVPPFLQLLGIYVCGGHWQAEETAGRSWQVILPHPTLPSQVVVFFQGKLQNQTSWGLGSSLRLEIPSFENCRVREIWWQLGGDGRDLWAGTLRSCDSGRILQAREPLEGAVARLRSLAAMLRVATAELPALEVRDRGWFEGWLELWQSAELEVSRELRLSAREHEELHQELVSIRSGVSPLLTQWDNPREGQGGLPLPPWQNAVDGLWPGAVPPAFSYRVWMDPESCTEVLLEVWPVGIEDLLNVFGGIGLALACIALAGVGSLRRFLLSFFASIPWAAVVLGGVGWWLWFRPSVLGFLLMVAGALGGVSHLFRKVG